MKQNLNKLQTVARQNTLTICRAAKTGMRCWEIKAQKPDGEYMIVLLCDYGYKTGGEVIEIHPFVNRKERNEEICRLYYEKGVSQLFLANLFNMSQPSVSVIVNKK